MPVVFLLLAVLSFTGCATVLDSAVTTAGERVGEAAGRMAGDRIVRQYTPQFTRLYASYMFAYAFTPAGYWVETNEYEPGDWTKWRFGGNDETTDSWLERAFLRRLDDGREWWRVTMYDADAEDTITLEALFDSSRSQILRLRGKFPDREVSEIPVEEGTMVYADPIVLTEESLEGATVGTETVTVPAGRYTARRIRYGGVSSGTVEWWLVDTVPGGYVKYAVTDPDQDADEENDVEGLKASNWTLELTEVGSDATTQLGSF